MLLIQTSGLGLSELLGLACSTVLAILFENGVQSLQIQSLWNVDSYYEHGAKRLYVRKGITRLEQLHVKSRCCKLFALLYSWFLTTEVLIPKGRLQRYGGKAGLSTE